MPRSRSNRLAIAVLGAAAAIAVTGSGRLAAAAQRGIAAVAATPTAALLPARPAPDAVPAQPPAPASPAAQQAAPAAPAPPAAPQEPHGVVSSEISVSRTEGRMQLELSDGRDIEFALRNGHMFADGRDIGPAPRGGALEHAWRGLLNSAMDTPTDQLPALLSRWSPPSDATSDRLKDALAAAVRGADMAPSPPTAAVAPAAPAPPAFGANSDSLARLQERVAELQQRLESMQDHDVSHRVRAEEHSWMSPLRYLWRGFSDVLGTLVLLAVLFGIGFAGIYFGGRPYLEAVADTARTMPMRSWLVGLAASFLVVPAFVLGILALTISIVGIPALLIFVPLFPVAIVLAAVLGYLGVAHAAGEALAERRLYATEWFHRGNSYYFLLTGLGLLLALFIAGGIVEMAGPWLGFIHGTLAFLGVVATWFAVSVGFGAVLLSRAGTRPPAGTPPSAADRSGLFEEETHA